MNKFFDDAKRIYGNLSDDESRRLYQALAIYNLTEDKIMFKSIADDKIKLYVNEIVCNARKEHSRQKWIMWGAGFWGKMLLSTLHDIEWTAVADNNKSGMLNDIPIWSAADVKAKSPDAFIVISSTKYGEEIKEDLLSQGYNERNILVIGEILCNIEKDLVKKQYFDLACMPHDNDEVFVDVGAYDAESSLNFIKWTDGRYKKIHLFEANTDFYARCKDNLERNGVKNYTLYPKGLWNEPTTLTFYESPYDSEYNVNLDEHNSFEHDKFNKAEWTAHNIDVVRMDDYIDDKVTFIKMDIEGSEANALLGAERIIRTYKPKLAISVYHRKDDMWVIPNIILQFNPDYKFYLRNYTFHFGESVLYAI